MDRRGAERARCVVSLATSALVLASAAAFAHQSPDLEALIQRATEALSRAEVDAAVRLLEAGRSEHGSDARLLFYLGRAYLEAGRPGDAVATLRRARAAAPRESLATLFWEGVALQRTGDFDAARERFGAVLEAEPRSQPARLQLGWMALAEERAVVAAEIFASILEHHPGSAAAAYYLGVAHHAAGELDAARDAYTLATDLEPGHVAAHVALGRVEVDGGNRDAARRALQVALELEPERPDANFELARLELATGEVEIAVERLQRVIADDPSHAPAHYQLGLAYRRAGRVLESEAVLASHAALQSKRRTAERRALDTAAARSTYDHALELLAAGRPEEAASAFRAVLRSVADAATAAPWLGLGAACLESGELDCAVDALRRAAAIETDLPAVHLLLAQALDARGEPAAAALARQRWRELVEAERSR